MHLQAEAQHSFVRAQRTLLCNERAWPRDLTGSEPGLGRSAANGPGQSSCQGLRRGSGRPSKGVEKKKLRQIIGRVPIRGLQLLMIESTTAED